VRDRYTSTARRPVAAMFLRLMPMRFVAHE
jgi:hypothetical protein